jgi:hypothetical protein
VTQTPNGLAVGGRSLWAQVTEEHNLDVVQVVTLLEACRAKDRLDRLDVMVRAGSSSWGQVGSVTLSLDPERLVNQTAGLMKHRCACQAATVAGPNVAEHRAAPIYREGADHRPARSTSGEVVPGRRGSPRSRSRPALTCLSSGNNSPARALLITPLSFILLTTVAQTRR